MKILMVLMPHDQPGDAGRRTGFRLEEFAAPYYVFADAGAAVTLASPRGGQPLLDPGGDPGSDPGRGTPAAQTGALRRLAADPAARAALANTSRLAELHAGDYDALFYPGGRGPLWALATDPASPAPVGAVHAAGRPAEACHAPAAFSHARAQDGSPLVSRRPPTGSGGSEATRPAGVVPLRAQDRLRGEGGIFQKAPDWQPCVLVDATPAGGRHPASAEATARVLLRMLGAPDGPRPERTP